MPRSTRTTYESLIWRGLSCRVSTTHDHQIKGWTVITLRAPDNIPFPLGVRGYCRHGLEQEKLEAAGGAVAYFRAWADRNAELPAYLQAVARHRQRDLFT